MGLIFQANSLSDEGREDQLQTNPEANLITNLALIDDIMLMLEEIKKENFRQVVNQASQECISSHLINDNNVIHLLRLNKTCTGKVIMSQGN